VAEPRIREVAPGDLPRVRELLVETWHATYDAIYGRKRVTEITDDWHSVENLTVQMLGSSTVFLVAETASGIDATSLARDKGHGIVMLERLYVRLSRHGHGLGTELLNATLDRFAEAALVRLEVEAQNKRAIDFYSRHGFAIADRTDHGGGMSSIVAHVMERSLPSR
jgi:ribosomal protein S18 acetylase RimI-like enzyme